MSVITEIDRIKTNIANAYDKAEEKNATIPETRNSENLAETIESIGEWKPQPDWWDIKSIVENDTEDYPAKAIFLMTDTTLKQIFSQNNFFNAEKIKFSDGQIITENGQYTIEENGLKQCSLGYKTYYAIVYLKSTTIDFSYTNMMTQFRSLKFVYFYNVETLHCDSSWGLRDMTSTLEAWLSNKPFTIYENMTFNIANAWNLQKLPNISLYNRGTNSFSHASVISVSNAPKLKKEEIIKVVSNFSAPDSGGKMNTMVNTFLDETIDLEQDFDIIPSKITKYARILGMKEIVELDFLNATSVERYGCCVRDVRNIKNIVRSNNYFECNSASQDSYIISRNTLLKVLDALADYSTDTENTYVLTLGSYNLSKLTEEEIEIATDKGWTVA